MRAAMADAEVGDDVYGEDPSVDALERAVAERLGMPAGLFVASGTQSNLCALLTHCQRGDEYVAGQTAHTYRFEAGGAATLGGIQPQPIPFTTEGTLDLDDIRSVIKPDDFHFARTRLVCLENTQGGKPIAPGYFGDVRDLAETAGLNVHLDGARLFNAAVSCGVEARAYAAFCDSVSICLSKGLGAPVGSVLVGQREFIDRARRWRKMLGGGMRQAGVIAAAGLYAMEHNVERLVRDHERASILADVLRAKFGEDLIAQHTNMVFLNLPDIDQVKTHLAENDVLISGPRLVVHLDVDDAAIDRVSEAIKRLD